ncbi:hypothetical protein ACFLVN_02660 [Chloroflexota bacterium]
MVFPKASQPLVIIILHVFDDVQHTHESLESIIAYTTVPCHVIVVDHSTTAETKDLLNRLENVDIIDGGESSQEIYGLPQDQFAKLKYILLLRSGVVVVSGYLEQMVEAMESDQSCGAVGCKIISGSGYLLQAGGITWNDNTISDYGFGDMPEKPQYAYIREVDFCSSICLLIKREVFQEIHSSDKSQDFSYYEGFSICRGIRDIGYKVVYQPAAVVLSHFQVEFCLGRTNAVRRRDERKEPLQPMVVRKKRDKQYGNDLLIARSVRKTQRILVLDDNIPAIRYGCGFPRLHSMLRCLAELGCLVTFFPVQNPVKLQPTTKQLQQYGIEIFWNHYIGFEQFAAERSQYYDIVLISRPTVF